ncbi:leucine-rich repeat domain-containing protein [Prevotella stercorea]|uniref:leucine-rich repeat domain-containing protein n=1 Tax=Leyella stercorea TaxID=363265 RepID=UPI001F3C84F9|nr:leucine-rich repeat domain-containing protein [Leyella stercorea]MCF2646025.1 leucine-rich repeat domain-containing protein [Leyella stercorea]MDY3968080.1 leucine-rich repeat domain-containing protein [Prevotella sp.]
MKRVYFTLTLMSLFGGLNAFAQSYETIDGVKYGLMKDGQCIVIGDDGAKGDITFKKEVYINGGKHTVTAVCGLGNYSSEATDQKKGFSENTNITGITFEEGSQIKWIGDHAFKNCSSLKTINNVPAGLTDINEWCFESTALESVDLSNTNVTIMKDGVFYNNKSLTSIKLPNKLENFWDNAFNGCTSLNNIVMPSTVVGIHNNVFEGCTSLSNVTFNDSYTTLGHHVFKNCPLAAVTFPNTLNSIGEYAFENTKLNTVDLSNTQITSLPNGCFFICENLSDVKLPKDLTDIGNNAFISTPIASITFPSSLQKIGDYAFQKAKLENVVIPTNCNAIEQGAFSENANLTTVVVNGLECYLAVSAFAKCDNLKDVYITSDKEPNAERYGSPFQNNPTVHVVPNYLETFKGLNTCNTTNFDSNFSITPDKEWTTFTSAYNLDFSGVKGLTAYTAKYDKANDAVALTQVKRVKAHTGLILKGEAGNTYTLPILASNEAKLDAVDNQLIGCVDALWSTGRDKDYFLYNGEFVKSKNDGWVLPGKSYLYIDGGRNNVSASQLRVYVDNTATAIDGITNNPVVKDDAYYNLQGVKVQRPQHGVFIHNGKKVVLK